MQDSLARKNAIPMGEVSEVTQRVSNGTMGMNRLKYFLVNPRLSIISKTSGNFIFNIRVINW